MDVFEAIEKRHSYRGPFAAGPVPREDLRKIVEAGILAPSGYNDQTTSFVIVDDADTIRKIGQAVGNDRVGVSPALIIVLMDKIGAGRDLYFGIEDYSAAAENMLLAVTAMGYASVWIDGVLRRENRALRVAEILAAPNSQEVRIVLPVGRPTEELVDHPKKPFEERAWFNRYGGES